jgi:hypothetical protein
MVSNGVVAYCFSGNCRARLEPERFMITPGGLEVVLAEDDTDFQYAYMNAAGYCDPMRYANGTGSTRLITTNWPFFGTETDRVHNRPPL